MTKGSKPHSEMMAISAMVPCRACYSPLRAHLIARELPERPDFAIQAGDRVIIQHIKQPIVGRVLVPLGRQRLRIVLPGRSTSICTRRQIAWPSRSWRHRLWRRRPQLVCSPPNVAPLTSFHKFAGNVPAPPPGLNPQSSQRAPAQASSPTTTDACLAASLPAAGSCECCRVVASAPAVRTCSSRAVCEGRGV